MPENNASPRDGTKPGRVCDHCGINPATLTDYRSSCGGLSSSRFASCEHCLPLSDADARKLRQAHLLVPRAVRKDLEAQARAVLAIRKRLVSRWNGTPWWWWLTESGRKAHGTFGGGL